MARLPTLHTYIHYDPLLQAKFPLTLLPLLLLTISPRLATSTSDEVYILQQLFESALNTTHNIKLLQESFLPDSDASVVCLPIKYNFSCTQVDPCVNHSTTWYGCQGSGYRSSYLWTSFNTKTFSGVYFWHGHLVGYTS